MDRRGLKYAIRAHLSHHFKVAADHAFIPQNTANLVVAVHRDAAAIGRFHRWRFASHQASTNGAGPGVRAKDGRGGKQK